MNERTRSRLGVKKLNIDALAWKCYDTNADYQPQPLLTLGKTIKDQFGTSIVPLVILVHIHASASASTSASVQTSVPATGYLSSDYGKVKM